MTNHATVSRSAEKPSPGDKRQEGLLLGASRPELIGQRAAINGILHGPSAPQGMMERAAPPIVQPKLTVGPEGDRYEQQADRVAAQVVDGLAAVEGEGDALSLAATGAAAETKPDIQRMPAGLGGTTVAPGVQTDIVQARGDGQFLPASIRPSLEHAFGADFGGVRVHADGESDRLSRELNARAFTTGQDIFFKAGAYAPGTKAGRHLLAHELTHVVQQAGNQVRPRSEVKPGAPASSEPEAFSSSDAVTAYGAVPANTIQRTIDRPGWVRSAKEPTKIAKAVPLGRKSFGYEQYYLEGPSGQNLGRWPASTTYWIQAPDVEQENDQQQHEESFHPEKQEQYTDKSLSPIGTVKENEEVQQEESKLTERQQDALKLIENFRAENTRLKNAFGASQPVAQAYLNHLKTRIEEPKEIDQSKTGLCGMAAFLHAVASDDPEAYAKYALNLFETGSAKIGDLKVKATKRIIHESMDLKEKFSMSLVDYVTCASLRIDRNKVNKNPKNLGTGFVTPLTRPGPLEKLFKGARYKVVDETNIRRPHGKSNFQQAVNELRTGKLICLFVDWNVHEPKGGDKYEKVVKKVAGIKANHWVVLKDVEENANVTTIQLYSEGAIVSIAIKNKLSDQEQEQQASKEKKDVISWEQFYSHYYGYIAAWKPAIQAQNPNKTEPTGVSTGKPTPTAFSNSKQGIASTTSKASVPDSIPKSSSKPPITTQSNRHVPIPAKGVRERLGVNPSALQPGDAGISPDGKVSFKFLGKDPGNDIYRFEVSDL